MYSINVGELFARHRNGRLVGIMLNEMITKQYKCRSILSKILVPLGMMWNHSSLVNKVKKSVVLFEADVSMSMSFQFEFVNARG